MSKTLVTEQGQDKQEYILAAAIKRFSHFGIGKTTLTEIADDTAMSRQAFLYYFHDKNTLIAAVTRRLIDEYMNLIEHSFETASNVEEALLLMLDVKRELFFKYSLLALQSDKLELANTQALKAIIQEAKIKHVGLLTALLEKGVTRQELKPLKSRRTAKLILQTLTAFEQCIRYKSGLPEEKELSQLFNTQKEVLILIINGLRREA